VGVNKKDIPLYPKWEIDSKKRAETLIPPPFLWVFLPRVVYLGIKDEVLFFLKVAVKVFGHQTLAVFRFSYYFAGTAFMDFKSLAFFKVP